MTHSYEQTKLNCKYDTKTLLHPIKHKHISIYVYFSVIAN